MKILLVDDDSAVLQALVALLQRMPGHDVRGAATGGQALQNAMAMGGIDLLISDVVMEPMDGFTLRDQIAQRYSAAHTIFISGYDLSDYAGQTAGHQVLAKPIEEAELVAAIEREFPQVEAPAEPAAPAIPEPEPEPVVASVAEVAQLPTMSQAELPLASVAVPATPAVSAPKVVATPKVAAVPKVVAVPKVAVAAAANPTAPTVVATPKVAEAVPVAVAAIPKAVAAVPKAVAATPKAVAATPKAVAMPKAVPAAAAKASAPTPVAVSRAGSTLPTSAPTPTVALRPSVSAPSSPSIPTPTVKAAPTVKAMAKPVAVPKAAAKPIARPAAVLVAASPVAPVPPPPSLEPDEFVGQTIGTYEIKGVLGAGRWGRVYSAVQTSINRQVGLNLLDPAKASDETARARFVGDARAKAHVQHPSILAVYEAGEANGHVFYTHEFVDGRTMAAIAASGEKLDELTALKVLKAAAEGLNYLDANHIAHSAPDAASVFLGHDGHARLANLATDGGDDQLAAEEEIQALGRIMFGAVPPIQSLSPGLRTLLSRMVQAGPQAIGSWGALVQGVKALEPKAAPAEAAKISAQDRAAGDIVARARKAQRKSLYINILSLTALVLISGFVVWHFVGSNERSLGAQVHIPAGAFVFGHGEQAETGEFWIDQYEVTLGEYAKFVEFLEQHPTTEYDHERQPHSKAAEMHKPRDWEIYYGRAKQGLAIHSVPSDLNMPAIMVDWWMSMPMRNGKGANFPPSRSGKRPRAAPRVSSTHGAMISIRRR